MLRRRLEHREVLEVRDERVGDLREPTLVTDDGDTPMRPGMCAGFAANGSAHHLENRTSRDVVVLEVGDRAPGDRGSYPSDDIQAAMGEDGKWRFTHKDGKPY